MLEQNTPHTFYYLPFWIKLLAILVFSSTTLFSGEWANSTLQQMTLREKAAQLFMIPVWTHGKQKNVDKVITFLETSPVGGIIFMQGTIPDQQKAAKILQQKSTLPLLVGQDDEWGLNMRLKDSLRFPRNLMLGALQDTNLIYEMGLEVANQCQGVGVHINFAPVIDINNNPLNPVINDRSFGESPEKVTQCGLLYMKGLQDGGIMACAKHFPGHGDTHTDSHLALPVIDRTQAELNQVEWMPFKALIEGKVGAIMLAHLYFPLIADEHPSSLSPNLIQGSLKGDLGFKGLVFTDSLHMKSITNQYETGTADLLALIAGNDVILISQNVPKALNRIEKGIELGEITESEIDEKVLKILEAKEQFHLHHDRFLDTSLDLFSNKALRLKKRLFREALTLIQNKNVLPLKSKTPIAFVQVGRDVSMKDALELVEMSYEEQSSNRRPPFFTSLSQHYSVDYFFLPKKSEAKDLSKLLKQLELYQKVVVAIYEMNKYERLNFGLCDSTFTFLESLREPSRHIYLTLFGSPYSLRNFDKEDFILMGYENDEEAQIGASEILMGKRSAQGCLPITASEKYPLGHGLH